MLGIPIVAALLSIATAQSLAQTAAALPIPSGGYSVGRASFHWFDPKRREAATESVDDKREILVQVWYPAAKPGRNPGPYMPGFERLASSAAADSLSNLFGPGWRSIASNGLRTHSFEMAPVASGRKLPILVFSPGGGVPVVAYTTQMEELASQGYVVIGVDHTYEAPGVVFRTDGW